MTESSPAVRYERAGFVARITRNRPETPNASPAGVMSGRRDPQWKGK